MPDKKPTILLVDDDEGLLFGLERSLAKAGYSVLTATCLKDARDKAASNSIDSLLLDLKLPDGNSLEWIPELKKGWPDLPVIVMTGDGDVPTAVTAMKYGAENFLVKPVEPDSLEMSLQKALEVGELRRQNRVHRRLSSASDLFFGAGPAAAALLRQLEVAASNDSAILITGETGTGKGVLARWIHEHGLRKKGALVELNCSCLKGDLLRSELFGHARGSFTSAVSDREGLVEIADNGTLFLDEIGDMDPAVQAQLLKTLEERTYRRVGENRLRKSDFRLVCATNKDLLKETESGAFRKDLYYRICVFPIAMPPLRERTEDIAGLAEYFLRDLGYAGPPLPQQLLHMLKEYQWPGNIRELRNMLERAVLLAQGQPLTIDCFPGFETPAGSSFTDSEKPAALHEIEREYLKKVVKSCNGDKKKACELLGISLATIYRKLGPVPPPKG